MGGLWSWLTKFWQQEMEISIVGCQGAGKSTFIQVIQRGTFNPDMMPTIGFNMYKVKKGKVAIKVWDLGGQERLRVMWERYCRKCDAIVFMVDSANQKMFESAKAEMQKLLSCNTLDQIPLLVLFNKCDLPNHAPGPELVKALELKKISGREVAYYETSCKDIINIDVTLDWLMKHSK
jgi:ADP-ribosylation factor-like protein 8